MKVKKGGMDITYLILVLLLLTFGLIMLFSASYASAYYYKGNSLHYISRQFMFAIVGVVAMLAASLFDYHFFRRFTWILYAGSLVLVAITLVMPAVNGAHRWIILPGIGQFQPSEVAKFAIIIVFAHLVSKNYDKMKTFRYGIVPFVGALIPPIGIMFFQPHLSGIILLTVIGLVMMFVGGTNAKWFGLAAVGGGAAIGVVALLPGMVDYAASRLKYWIDPFADASDKGFQTIQSLYAIGSGGLMGSGIGGSRQKYLYLPEVQNDFVFSIVCEELGFIGATIIIILFALLTWRGFVIAAKAPDKFGAIMAIGLTTQVSVQAILNIAVVTNTIPNTGISLPFFSYGGTSLMMLLAQMGVVLAISRQTSLEKE